MSSTQVQNLLNEANRAADEVTDSLKDAFSIMKALDTATRNLTMKLLMTRLEPDERVHIAQQILELQVQRAAVVKEVMPTINTIKREML